MCHFESTIVSSYDMTMKKFLAFIFWGLLWCEGAYALPKCKGDDHARWTQRLGSYLNSNKNKITAE